MGSRSDLDDYFENLRKEMLKLKELRDDVATRKEARMAGWLQIVKDKEGEVGEFEMELKKLQKSRLPRPSAKEKLKERIIESIRTVKALIESKDAISLAMETFISEVATGKPTQFSEGQLKEYTSKFTTEVGSGDFGVVFKGVLRNNMEIAVKVLHDSAMDNMEKQFKAEVNTMSRGMDNMEKQFKAEVNTMTRTSHRNLAKLYGYCFDAKKKALVYEFVKNGSLDKILYDRHSNITWDQLYDIATQIAKGLSYLHENCDERIIHRDIKAGNVLLDSNFCPKLTDFGLAKFYSINKNQTALSSDFRAVRNYDAPELRFGNKRKVSYKCDVFSFGVMLFEILMRKKCEGDNSLALLVWDKFQKGVLAEFITDQCGIAGEKDTKNAMTLSIVALLCIEHKPQDRPSMSKVVNILTDVIKPSTPLNPFLNHNTSSENILSLDSTGGSGGFETPQIIFPTINEREPLPSTRFNPRSESYKTESVGTDFQGSKLGRNTTRESESLFALSEKMCPPQGENSVIIYTTTLRENTKIFEECNMVRSILRSHQIQIFERDLVQNPDYKAELRNVLWKIVVPTVFVKGKFIGGAEEVMKMEAEGTLQGLLYGIPKATN